MTPAPLAVRWIAGDAARVRAMLCAALGVTVPAGRRIALPGLRLEIVDAEPGGSSRAADRLEGASWDTRPGTASTADDLVVSGARFLALGWATVDADRVAARWPGSRWTAAPRDSLLGARARLGGPGAIVLLEPDTEGRLAAALARHGEGPAALYLELADATGAGASTRLAGLGVRISFGSGPFGPGIAVMSRPAWSPALILVPAGVPGGPAGSARSGRGTIPA